jgi:hypothetical protein
MVKLTYLKGIVQQPYTKCGKEYWGLYLRPSEMVDAVRKWRKKPVCVDHDTNQMVGMVVKLEIDQDGNLVAHLWISDETEAGKRAIVGIRNGDYYGLSLGMKTNNYEHTPGGRVEWMVPTEISICAEPGREGCFLKKISGENQTMTSIFVDKHMTQEVLDQNSIEEYNKENTKEEEGRREQKRDSVMEKQESRSPQWSQFSFVSHKRSRETQIS